MTCDSWLPLMTIAHAGQDKSFGRGDRLAPGAMTRIAANLTYQFTDIYNREYRTELVQ